MKATFKTLLPFVIGAAAVYLVARARTSSSQERPKAGPEIVPAAIAPTGSSLGAPAFGSLDELGTGSVRVEGEVLPAQPSGFIGSITEDWEIAGPRLELTDSTTGRPVITPRVLTERPPGLSSSSSTYRPPAPVAGGTYNTGARVNETTIARASTTIRKLSPIGGVPK